MGYMKCGHGPVVKWLNSPVWMSRQPWQELIAAHMTSAHDLLGPAKIWRSMGPKCEIGMRYKIDIQPNEPTSDRDLTVLCITRDMIGKLRGRRREEKARRMRSTGKKRMRRPPPTPHGSGRQTGKLLALELNPPGRKMPFPIYFLGFY